MSGSQITHISRQLFRYFILRYRRALRFAWLAVFFLMTLITLGTTACSLGEENTITVDANKILHPVNRLIFGQNVLFSGNGMWNVGLGGLDPGAAVWVKDITPTILRFPGGSTADTYMWEDGLGYRTTAPLTPTTSTITLDGTPNWGLVRKARIIDAHGGRFGEPFSFLRREGNRLETILGVKNAHPAGAVVRPEVRRGQSDWFSNEYGIMEHMKLAASLGAKVILTVNYSTGLDKEGAVSTKASLSQRVKRAAAFVAFVNGRADDPRPLGVDEEGYDWQTVGYWAKKRAERGHPAPYGVRYWEIGNEVYDRSEVGFTTAQQYGQDYLVFARAMKEVDPSIKTGVVGLTNPRGLGDKDQVDQWNPTVAKLTREHLDFFILHPYYPAAGRKPAPYHSPAWFAAVLAGAPQAMTDVREIRTIIDANAPRATPPEIVITEYGIWPAASQDNRDFSSLAGALNQADLLMAMLRDGPALKIPLATAWNLHGSNGLAAINYNWNTGSRSPRPQYFVFKLMMNHLASQLLDTRVAGATFAISRVANVMANKTVPVLGAIAAISPDRKRLTLLVLNRALTGYTTAEIRLLGFTPQAAATVYLVNGRSPAAHNEEIPPGVGLTTKAFEEAAASFRHSFPAHSLTLLEFRAKGN